MRSARKLLGTVLLPRGPERWRPWRACQSAQRNGKEKCGVQKHDAHRFNSTSPVSPHKRAAGTKGGGAIMLCQRTLR
jgi:hypothetical protein